jgi:predicted SnoaL-like aldol condensation-catalyzing enzyme
MTPSFTTTCRFSPALSGDYVMIHGRDSNPDGSAIVVVDILQDGVFEEHWDVIQPEATKKESKSKLPMFGDSFPR